MKTVSIIIPAKNEAKYIGQCLASLSTLEFPTDRYEVIVVDNGSSDNTVDIAKSFSVNVLSLPEKKTISAVRNGGVATATGDILVFLDADCTVTPNWLRQAEIYFDRNDVACFGSSPVIPEQATWVEQTWFLVRKSQQQIFERQWQESTNMFIPKIKFDQAGGFNETLTTCEDVDLSYRLLPLGKIISDSRIISIHHRDPKTIREFFLKEKWRGKNNYTGLMQHGLKLSELPSLLLPLYCTGLLAATFVTMLIFHSIANAVILFCLAQIPVMGLIWLKMRWRYQAGDYIRLLFLYNIYFIARAAAIFPSKK